ILGIPLVALSLTEAYAAFRSPQRNKPSAYLPSVLAMLGGNVLLLSSALVVSGLLFLLIAILLLGAFNKLLTAWRGPAFRLAATINGLIDFGCAALLWYLSRIIGVEEAIGIVVGLYIAAAGWRMLMAPAEEIAPDAAPPDTGHPDRALRLPPNEIFAHLR